MSEYQADVARRDIAARVALLNEHLELGATLEVAVAEAGLSLRAVKRWLEDEHDERIGAKARAKLAHEAPAETPHTTVHHSAAAKKHK